MRSGAEMKMHGILGASHRNAISKRSGDAVTFWRGQEIIQVGWTSRHYVPPFVSSTEYCMVVGTVRPGVQDGSEGGPDVLCPYEMTYTTAI